MKVQQIIKIAISAVAMIAVMVAIFAFSGQDGATSAKVSDSVGEKVLDILDIEIPPGETASSVPVCAGLNIRKCAHLFMYMLLGLTSFLFIASLFGLKRQPLKLGALYISIAAALLCFAYACFDELHQSFINDRTMALADVGIDSIGYLSLIAVSCTAYLIASFIKRNRNKNLS